jgi:hypothetical protein
MKLAGLNKFYALPEIRQPEKKLGLGSFKKNLKEIK